MYSSSSFSSHVNRTTQFENPVLSNKRGDKKINSMNHEPPSMLSSRVKNDDVEPSARYENSSSNFEVFFIVPRTIIFVFRCLPSTVVMSVWSKCLYVMLTLNCFVVSVF